MAEDRFLLDSPAIEKAVAFHNSADYPPRRPGKNSLDDVPAMGGSAYNGMFAVKRDENGIYVSPGYTDLGEFAGGYVKEGDPSGGFVCLVASLWDNEDRFSVRCAPIPFDALYQAGHYVYWEIAKIGFEVVQLHMGMIAFRERFYIS